MCPYCFVTHLMYSLTFPFAGYSLIINLIFYSRTLKPINCNQSLLECSQTCISAVGLPAARTLLFLSHNNSQVCAVPAVFVHEKQGIDFGAFHSET